MLLTNYVKHVSPVYIVSDILVFSTIYQMVFKTNDTNV